MVISKTAIAFVIIGLLLQGTSMTAQLVTPDYSDISYAELIVSVDPHFDVLRLDIIKSSGTNETIDNFSRVSVLLKNNYSKPVLGYAIRWNGRVAHPSPLFCPSPQTWVPHPLRRARFV